MLRKHIEDDVRTMVFKGENSAFCATWSGHVFHMKDKARDKRCGYGLRGAGGQEGTRRDRKGHKKGNQSRTHIPDSMYHVPYESADCRDRLDRSKGLCSNVVP